MNRKLTITTKSNRIVGPVYIITMFLMALTGFGQMPIYKRYYMSDIPGFGWLANFWTTRYVHYLGAVVLLAFFAFIMFDHLLIRRKLRKLTMSGYIRATLLAGIVITGILFVIKNFPIHVFSAQFIIFLDLCHLGFVMSFLLVSLYCLLFKKKWTTVI
jgi:hypothetical protein